LVLPRVTVMSLFGGVYGVPPTLTSVAWSVRLYC
jgi:hypothetical protein